MIYIGIAFFLGHLVPQPNDPYTHLPMMLSHVSLASGCRLDHNDHQDILISAC